MRILSILIDLVMGVRLLIDFVAAHAVAKHILFENGVIYRGTSLIRKRPPPGLYRKPMPRVLAESLGVGVSL